MKTIVRKTTMTTTMAMRKMSSSMIDITEMDRTIMVLLECNYTPYLLI